MIIDQKFGEGNKDLECLTEIIHLKRCVFAKVRWMILFTL